MFRKTDWNGLRETEIIDVQYDMFLELYTKGTQQHIPKVKEFKPRTPEWFNARCREAKQRKELTWKRWNRHKIRLTRDRFVTARNKYTEIRREEARKFEKDIVEKGEKEPKILYAHINRRTKVKNKLQRLKVEGVTYETDRA